MALSQVRIKAFKSIVDQTIDLGQLNVFIGTNGAGKSNLLEAIGVLSCAVDGKVDYSKLADRGVRLSAPEVFKSSFKNLKCKNTFSLEMKSESLTYKANINVSKEAEFNFDKEKICNDNENKLAERNKDNITLLNSALFENPVSFRLEKNISIFSTLESIGQFNDSELKELKKIQRYAIYSPSTPILRGVSPDGSNKELLGLYGGGLAKALSDVIKEAKKSDGFHDLQRFFALLDWFESIGTTEDISTELQSSHLHTGKYVVTYIDKFMNQDFNNLYAYDVSEGALYILFILVLLRHKKAPLLFALDNVDSALNPGMVRDMMGHIVELLKDTDKQILMTTHNPTTLDAIDLFNDNHRLFVVERNAQGHTEIRRIAPPKNFTREQWIEKHKGMPLSKIWLAGLIGGLAKGF